MTIADTWARINLILQHFKHYDKKIAMLLIVNLQSELVTDDYDDYSVVTSYYSNKDLDDIVKVFMEFVDYIDISYGEAEFVKKAQSGFFNDLNSYHKIAYTESATGTTRSKSALLPAICELFQIKYCSNDIFTAALFDNKLATYQILKSYGFPLPETWVYKHGTGWMGSEPPDQMMLITKPAYECASLGIGESSVSMMSPVYLQFIDQLSIKFRQPVLVQQFIHGYEVEVPVFDSKEPLTPCAVGISLNDGKSLGERILSYDTIFDDGFDLFNYDEHDEVVSSAIKSASNLAYKYLQLKGPVRIDYRITETGEYFMMDYNNSPHLGKQHSFAFVAKELGLSYSDMLKIIVFPALNL